MRLFNRSQGQEEDGSGSDDGEQTLDLSVSRDTDGQVTTNKQYYFNIWSEEMQITRFYSNFIQSPYFLLSSL